MDGPWGASDPSIPVPLESNILSLVQQCNFIWPNIGFIAKNAFIKAGKETLSVTWPWVIKWLKSRWSSSLNSLIVNACPQEVHTNAFYLEFPPASCLLSNFLKVGNISFISVVHLWLMAHIWSFGAQRDPNIIFGCLHFWFSSLTTIIIFLALPEQNMLTRH